MGAEELERAGEPVSASQPGAAVLKTRSGVLLAVAAVLLIAGCGSSTIELPVRTEYDRNTPFLEWKTFRLSSAGHGARPMRYPRYEEMVRQAVVEELGARGYTRIEDGTPDFRVAFELSFRGSASAQMAPEMGSTAPEEREPAGSNPAGSLTLRMLDPISAAPLWEGTISEFTINAIEPEKGLRTAVWRVLVEFPPLGG